MFSMTKVCCKNPYPDYSEASADTFLKNGKFNAQLVHSAKCVINKLLQDINSTIKNYNSQSDYSVYTGYSGITLLHMLNYKKTKDQDSFNYAEYLSDLAINNLNGRRVSFLNGDAGPLALGIVLKIWGGKKKEADDLIVRLLKLPDMVGEFPDEILYGRAGYLYALIFVIKHVGRVIPVDVIRHQMERLIRSGYKRGQKENSECPLKYEWHEKSYLGAAHGVAGILYILLINKDLLTEFELNSLIKPTIDWLLSVKFSSGNFPSSESNDRDRLVQWCHGAPGFVHLFAIASKVYNNETYRNVAIECGEVVWSRGLLVKGYSICHGVSGNAYTFLHLYKLTRDINHLYRLGCFVHWCTNFPRQQGLQPDRPLSLFEGKAGLTYFLFDALELDEAAFPAYEL